MGDGDTNNTAKKGNADYNPVDRGPPQEYLAIVGSPSITFNGYMLRDGEDTPSPAPADVSKVEAYIGRPYGELRQTQKDGADKWVRTHDLYWANFIDPAIRLHTTGVVKAPPGSLVTLLVWYPGYAQRNQRDWDASPFNPIHKNSVWVAKGIKDKDEDGWQIPPAKPSGRPKVAPNLRAPPSKSEPDIDHDILMRTTSQNEPKRGIVKWPKNSDVYTQYLLNATARIVYGPAGLTSARPAAVLSNVLVKVLLATEIRQITNYIATGAWRGKFAMNLLDLKNWHDPDEPGYKDMEYPGDDKDAGANYNFQVDFSSDSWGAYWKRSLSNGPSSVDRAKIKIRRFDYFGHSSYHQMYLGYGLANKKGERPGGEVQLYDTVEFKNVGEGAWDTWVDLQAVLNAKTVMKGATAKLWGCNLGLGMGPALTTAFKEVVACDNRTSFDSILTNDTNMPEPVDKGKWVMFKP